MNLSFLGISNSTAPYLPWVLLAFSVVLGSSSAVDLLGMVAGEAWKYSKVLSRLGLRCRAVVLTVRVRHPNRRWPRKYL